ncbi:MAG: 4Fe-4S binding protein [Coriobacteriales bacterium]|jgi:ferredoxin-type protein NapH|nr:4Fe-4S binding protein [Coriobacteriales bacterium]
MKSKQLRVLTALAAIVLIIVGFLTNFGIGTVSSIGWSDISILCPLGALGTMLASKLLIPRAVISLVIAIILIVVLGRAFCAWICPVPLVQMIRNLFGKKSPTNEPEASAPVLEAAASEIVTPADTAAVVAPTAIEMTTEDEKSALAPLSAEEQTALAASGCTSCAKKRSSVDARHFVLGGSLLSAAIFGFPVFCLICPIGLTFASILLVIRLFGNGDVTWSLILVPLLLIVEVLVFRKWCSKLCPLSAFMSLIGKLNRTFKPSIDDAACLETAQGRSCGICGRVCPEGIDPRHPELSTVSWSECTKCRECVDACPSKALRMPLFLPTMATKPKDGEMTVNGSGPHE